MGGRRTVDQAHARSKTYTQSDEQSCVQEVQARGRRWMSTSHIAADSTWSRCIGFSQATEIGLAGVILPFRRRLPLRRRQGWFVFPASSLLMLLVSDILLRQ